LAVKKKVAQKFHVEKFTLRKLEVKKQYQINISEKYAALQNFSDREDKNRAWENIKDIIKIQLKRV
jgi:hypothetical protein